MLNHLQAPGTDYLDRKLPSGNPQVIMREDKLLDGARKFDQQALSAIYDQFSPMIYRYAMRLVGNTGLAEDFVAETFTRFLQILKNGKGPDKYLKAYLFRITHNLITDHYRRQPEQQEKPIDDEITTGNEDTPRILIEEKIANETTRDALMQLTSDQSQVIALRYLEGLSNEEVASMMGKPVGAVKALQHRAIVNLRKLLTHYEEYHESESI